MAAFRMRTDAGIGRGSRRANGWTGSGGGASTLAAGVVWGWLPATEGRPSQLVGTACVRSTTPGTGSGSPQGATMVGVLAGPTGIATRWTPAEDDGPMIRRMAVSMGSATTRRPDAGRTWMARSAADAAPASTRARSASVRGGEPGDQATGADGATTMRVVRARTRNNSYPRHVAERGMPKVLHLVTW